MLLDLGFKTVILGNLYLERGYADSIKVSMKPDAHETSRSRSPGITHSNPLPSSGWTRRVGRNERGEHGV